MWKFGNNRFDSFFFVKFYLELDLSVLSLRFIKVVVVGDIF